MVNEYSIWLLPIAAQQASLTAVVVDLATRFGTPNFVPHVTIQGDLTAPLDRLASAMHNIGNEHKLRRWPVASIEGGDHYFRSLYLRFEENSDYLSMKRSMQLISGTTEGLSLFPHLSLAYGLTSQQRAEALMTELKLALREPLCFDRLVIARSSKNVPIADWECLAEFALGDAVRLCQSSGQE